MRNRNRKDEKQTKKRMKERKTEVKTEGYKGIEKQRKRDKVKHKERETGRMRKQKERETKSIIDRWKERKFLKKPSKLCFLLGCTFYACHKTNGFMAYDCFTN
jgi:hypothetical protein